MKPYIKYTVGTHSLKSQCAEGKTPVWINEKFLKFNMNGEEGIRVEAWDYDTFSKDDLIGTGYIAAS